MFGKTYELSLNKSYVRHWGVVEAVRELIQNALDSDSPFAYEFQKHPLDESYALTLTSEFASLPPQSLLLGATSKAEAKDKIGSFGEGYKIAMLVLVREDIALEIWNEDRHWKPFFQYSKKYADEILCVEEKAMPFRHKGLDFFVPGLTEEQVMSIRASCLQMQKSVGEKHTTMFGEILLEKPGMLYVGGLYICTTKMQYGYNIKPEFMRLERDRKTVDDWDLKTLTRDMWYAVGRPEEVAAMIRDGYPEMDYAQYSAPTLVKEACYKLFREQHPGALVAKSQQELETMVRNGMTQTVYVGDTYGSLVSQSPSYAALGPARIPATPHKKMEDWFSENKYHMHAKAVSSFRELLERSKRWRIS